MTRRLRVYSLIVSCPGWARHELADRNERYNGHRNVAQARAVVATTSRDEAARVLDTSKHHMRLYGGETANDEQVAVALERPGVPAYRGIDDRPGDPWLREDDE